MALVYDAGSRRTLIRAMILLSIPVGLLFWWLGFLGWNYPPEVGERAWERPLANLLCFGGGLGIVASMLVYGRCYISQVEVEDDGTVRIRTIAPFGSPEHVLRPVDVLPGEYHEGHFQSGGVRGVAPWHSIRLRGRRIPLILDPVGDVLDARAAERALGLEHGDLFVWDEDLPLAPSAPRPRLSEKARKRFKRARRSRRRR